MQSISARKEYRNSFDCAAKIFKNEGLLKFWSGALPRLVRLTVCSFDIVSFLGYQADVRVVERGHCVYNVSYTEASLLSACLHANRYEKTMELLDRVDPEKRYI